MRIKVDENLPLSLVEILKDAGHDADHVVTEGLTGRDDLAVWAAAQVEDRFLIHRTSVLRILTSRPWEPIAVCCWSGCETLHRAS
ncbi:MAG: DUF5615 family PIN-like protein [Thermoanaerobaculia bacterium]